MSDEKPKEWTLRELAVETGVAERTIRYYISREIVPPPLRGGRGAAYGEAHKARLEEIRTLQAKGLMLAEIAHALALGEGPKPVSGTHRGTGIGGEVRRMLWFNMDGDLDKRSNPEDAGPMLSEKRGTARNSPAAAPDRTLAEPETWRSYTLAPDVVVMLRTGLSPWRTKRLVSALRRFAAEIDEETNKEDRGE
jgi:DNA-binding transcriptional MerR regulator